MNCFVRSFLTVLLMVNAAGASAADVSPGAWRFAIHTPLGELPFNVELSRQDGAWNAEIVNGAERVAAEITRVDGPKLTLEFPSYASRIEGTVDDEGVLKGTVHLTREAGPFTIAFSATRGQDYRFFQSQQPAAADLSGRWAVAVTAADGITVSNGIGEFAQKAAAVDGSVIYVNADTRFLSGEMKERDLFLSTFYGGGGSLWQGTVGTDGRISGKTYSLVTGAVSTWRGSRDDGVVLPDPNTLTYLNPGYDRFEFSFPDLDGKTVTLDDPRFKDKVVIVTIGGSWCSTCHDEAKFLVPFVKENRVRGLEAVSLQFEYSPEFDKAAAACRNFARRYGVDYPMLIAGLANKAAASKSLPMINAVLVYPTMIVIDRKGEVRRIHTSFPGPATGVHHENFKREFTSLIDELLGEGV